MARVKCEDLAAGLQTFLCLSAKAVGLCMEAVEM